MNCKWCNQEAVRKQGRNWYCKKHYRFSQMRGTAKRRGKVVPSYGDLENLNTETGGKCPVCKRTLNWLSKDGTSTVVTLQHDRSGGVRFLCLSCNTRHASFPNDTFYSTDPNMRMCPRCKTRLPLSEFSKDNNGRWKNTNTYCRKCRTIMHGEWVSSNREKYNAKRRDYYHARKNAGNPIPR